MNRYHVVCSIVIVVGLSGCLLTRPELTTSGPRQISDNTLNLREQWRKGEIRVSGSPYDPSDLLAVDGRVICRLYDSVRRSFGLQVLDAAGGELLWKQEKQPNLAFLAVDAKRVYAMVDFEIFAYDLQNGQRLWESQGLPSHRSYYLHSDGERLYVRDMPDETYYLDATTGKMLSVSPLSTGDGFALLVQLPQLDIHTSERAVQAVDRTTHQVLWTTDIGNIGPVKQLPTLIDNVLLLGVWEQVFAIDMQTGQVKWRNLATPFASNFVVVNGSLYALDYNARLVQLDVKTGQEKGHIQFAPARTSVADKRYWVAADGQMLFVSFEDSQELIALGP